VIDVLIVDDEPDIAAMLQIVLECEGYTVEIAHHGGEALEWLNVTRPLPRMLLLDLSMPEMDGPTLLGHMAQRLEFSTIPVFVMTADRFPERRLLGLRYERLLTKPFALDTLLTTISPYFEQPRAA
jgi:CheY-like chemotaxis protein